MRAVTGSESKAKNMTILNGEDFSIGEQDYLSVLLTRMGVIRVSFHVGHLPIIL